MFRLAIYEDNHRLRNSMQLLLDDGVHFAITGLYAHCNKVTENMAQSQPDIVLMDIDKKEVFTLLVNGNSYKMIAGHCIISIETVKKHLRNIYTKLYVNCATEAVAKALREQIVPL